MCNKILHEMVQSCPLSPTRQRTEPCQLWYHERNIEPDPCCRKLKLRYKWTILLLLTRIGGLWDVFSLEDYARRYRYLLRSQRFLDIGRVVIQYVLDVVIKVDITTKLIDLPFCSTAMPRNVSILSPPVISKSLFYKARNSSFISSLEYICIISSTNKPWIM